ncbi:MAG: hypothetical protein AAF202_00345, partial [Pseudomonadota bacterium]
SVSAQAHQPTDSGVFNEAAYINLARQAISLNIQAPQARTVPSVKVGSETLYLDEGSAVWQMARGWLRIYYDEVKRDCEHCLPEDFDFDKAVAEAENKVAESFAENKIYKPLQEATEHIVEDSAMIGAKLGKEALALKIASEIAETIASKSVGGAGVHILCNIIDAVILFGMRHLQVAVRLPSWSKALGAGRFTGIKYWVVKRAVHRAKKRMEFLAGPIELDEEGLELLNAEKPTGNRRWFNFSSKTQRVRWLEWIEKRTAHYDQRIAEVETLLIANPNSRRLQRRKSSFVRQRQKLTRVKNKRGMFTSRMRKFRFLKGKGRLESAINGNVTNKGFLWILAMQEGILNRGLAGSVDQPNPEFQEFIAEYTGTTLENRTTKRTASPVALGLLDKYVQEGTIPESNQSLALGLSKDILEIFDPNLSKKRRYFKTVVLEEVMGRMLYKMMTHRLEQFESDKKSWLGRVNQTFFFNWKAGTYARYVFEFTDFLRIASVSSKTDFLVKHKHEAIETLYRLFAHLQKLDKAMLEAENATALQSEVAELNQELMQFRPWKEKRSVYRWVGLWRSKPVPQCAAMWEVHD